MKIKKCLILVFTLFAIYANALKVGNKLRNNELESVTYVSSKKSENGSNSQETYKMINPRYTESVPSQQKSDKFEKPEILHSMEKPHIVRPMESPVFIQKKLNKINEGNTPVIRHNTKPIFIQKSQKSTPMAGRTAKLTNVVKKADPKSLKKNLKKLKAKDRKKKLNALLKAKHDLVRTASSTKKEITKEVSDLMGAKSASMNLSLIIKKYDQKLKQDKLAKLKLTDRVKLKSLLKTKLIKELQGFRVKAGQYRELDILDKPTLKKIVKDIKSQLDH